MELVDLLKQLRQRRQQCVEAIELLQDLQGINAHVPVKPLTARKGRKSMGPEERQEVSLRMKRYWESRRAKTVGIRSFRASGFSASGGSTY